MSPTDGIGDWAIETELLCCGPGSRSGTFNIGTGMSLQLWPMDGLVVGAKIARLRPDAESMIEPAISDLELNTGYLTRLNRSLVARGDLVVELPTGQTYGTTDRVSVEMKALLGFSFTPRHDFFIRPAGGFASANNEESISSVGWTAGMAYQRPRFSLLLYGGNGWYFTRAIGPRFGMDVGFYLGWELGSGLMLGYRLDTRSVPDEVGGEGTELVSGFSLRWVFFPGDRRNRLRREDPQRGADWKWWNPDPRGPMAAR